MSDNYTKRFHELFDKMFNAFENFTLTEIVYEQVAVGTAARFARNIGDYTIFDNMSTETLLTLTKAFDNIYAKKGIKQPSLLDEANLIIDDAHDDVMLVSHKYLMEQSTCGRSTVSKFRSFHDGDNYIIKNIILMGNVATADKPQKVDKLPKESGEVIG